MSDDPDHDEADEADDAAAHDAPGDDAGSAAGYTRKLNEIEVARLESEQFWQSVFNHPVGRREMWGILKAAHAFETSFACGPNGFPQPEATWFHAGEQAIGMRLFLSWQVFNPEGVLAMLKEHDPRFKKPAPPKRKRGAR